MSRICVKNLSKTTNESSLKKNFSLKGEVTDVKLVKSSSGRSRQFAFIGFRSNAQADEALKYFNNTFLDNSRIVVEPARKVGEIEPKEVRSRHTKSKLEKISKAQVKPSSDTNKKSTAAKPSSQPLVEKSKLDFMEAMKPRSKKNFWSNDESRNANAYIMNEDDADNDQHERPDVCVAGSEIESENEQAEDEDEINDFTVKSKPIEEKKQLNEKDATTMSDMEYLRSKVKSAVDFTDSDSNSDLESEDEEQEKNEQESERVKHINESSSAAASNTKSLKSSEVYPPSRSGDRERVEEHQPSDDIKTDEEEVKEGGNSNAVTVINGRVEEEEEEDSGRLFVRNLPYSSSEDELRELFTEYGPLTEVHLPLDQERKGKGFGFVQFMIPENAQAARLALDGTAFQGRTLHLIPAKSPVIREPAEEGRGPKGQKLSAYQQKKEEARRKSAGKTDGWNSSYVRSDTVVEAVAEKYGMSRTDILDTTEKGGELAVRLAVAESHIIQDNREYLTAHGVDLTALESSGSGKKATKRSGTTLLLKNLPHDAVQQELETMLSNFGAIASFIFPPSRSIALVDFIEPSEARNAFKGLAYRKYKHVPLYLEWAPLGVIRPGQIKTDTLQRGKEEEDMNKEKIKQSKLSTSAENGVSEAMQQDGEDDGAEFSSLFVKNFNFQTTETDVRSHLTRLGCVTGLRAVSLPKKQRAGMSPLSMGFGFLEFRSAAQATDAMRRLQGSVLLEHSLEVKPSDKRISVGPISSTSSGHTGGKPTAKLVVRNVAFQTTKSELRSLFSSFGSVKSVRIPKKMGGVHRGFAFVELATSQEAESAKNALTNAHFYGRHLVIEWAKDDDLSLDELRKRAQADEGALRMERKRMKLEESLTDELGGPEGGFDDSM
mmetsp:Transcript_40843/g.41714  ORF Transcript_40843/g.41714 Transcript_40843/m.41714 type:complete len:888 (+) Transcript_40843:120-2783(+)|eukprot:CAMPEP_0182425398 /NCGR_PEP_ID=MMETSP1167-20130531/11831_1 /TAXON_ID=2988 /ORGANISM="Mallomonas Sp, Strain CCMP3275" /LENGTH=887 /DNA_ID=CAMNT_0024606099 /DNA_START=55 /DNA_END=2718 /DNA_ORIENTATION=+